MKVGIVTFHNGSNYGAALQCFALQEAEKKLGNDVYVINYNNRFISKGLDRFRFALSTLGFYYLAYDIINYFSNGRKIVRFKKFFDDYYNLTPLMDANALKSYNVHYDIGMSGSDQIWNALLNNRVDDIYFLNFGYFTHKVSYASSLGNYQLDNEEYNRSIIQLLSNYDRVSTRENSKLLESLINRAVYNVCDPTLLLCKEEWAEKLKLRKRQSKFLLIYALTDQDRVIEIARLISKEKSLPILFLGKTKRKYSGITCINDAGPKEFVELFYNAEYVVTNSFHGTAFSINFHKQFVSVKHPKSPERALHILKVTNLESRLVMSGTVANILDVEPAEFQAATCALEKLRNESYKYLMEL